MSGYYVFDYDAYGNLLRALTAGTTDDRLLLLTQTGWFCCHAEPSGEASGPNTRRTRRFDSQILRFAQNDNLPYLPVNETVTITDTSESVSLSIEKPSR